MSLHESDVEAAALDWFLELGYALGRGLPTMVLVGYVCICVELRQPCRTTRSMSQWWTRCSSI